MNGFRYAGNLAFYLSLCCAMFLSPPLAAEPQIAPGNPELIVLLLAGGDPIAVADAINSPSPLVPSPYGLETGNPVQAEILIEERPEGATQQWVLANPDRPLAPLPVPRPEIPQVTDLGNRADDRSIALCRGCLRQCRFDFGASLCVEVVGSSPMMRKEIRPKDLDFAAIRREAEAATKDFLENRWDRYMEMVRKVEAFPENQSGSDKAWVGQATTAWRDHYRNTRRVG